MCRRLLGADHERLLLVLRDSQKVHSHASFERRQNRPVFSAIGRRFESGLGYQLHTGAPDCWWSRRRSWTPESRSLSGRWSRLGQVNGLHHRSHPIKTSDRVVDPIRWKHQSDRKRGTAPASAAEHIVAIAHRYGQTSGNQGFYSNRLNMSTRGNNLYAESETGSAKSGAAPVGGAAGAPGSGAKRTFLRP
jgi:hypothetical protein